MIFSMLNFGSEKCLVKRISFFQTDVNIPSVLTENGLTTLVDLVVKADLANALSGAGKSF